MFRVSPVFFICLSKCLISTKVTFQETLCAQRTLHWLSTNFISLFHNKQVTNVKDSISAKLNQPVANDLSTNVNYCVMYLRMAINCSPGNVNRLPEMRWPIRCEQWVMRGHCWPVLGWIRIIVTVALLISHEWIASKINRYTLTSLKSSSYRIGGMYYNACHRGEVWLIAKMTQILIKYKSMNIKILMTTSLWNSADSV